MQLLKLLTEVCSIPTAPFAEQHVVRYVERFVAARRKLQLARDAHGNLLVEFKARAKSKQPRWIFAAHMDHPGFIATRMIDGRTLEAAFRGWVQIDYVRGTRVRFFEAGGREIAGTYGALKPDGKGIQRSVIGVSADVRVAYAVRGAPPVAEILAALTG